MHDAAEMLRHRPYRCVVVLGPTALLVACASSSIAAAPARTPAARPPVEGRLTGLQDPYGHTPPTGDTCVPSAIYFAYDSSDLTPEARDTLSAIARCIEVPGAASSARTTFVGMTDPRGTEEYNLALGERRARAALRYVGDLGVDAGRLDVRALGEEYAAGHDEAGWSRDRRVEVVP